MCGDLSELKCYVELSHKRRGPFDLNGLWREHTALTGAAQTNMPQTPLIVAHLLQIGCKPDVPNKSQITALMFAAQNNCETASLQALLNRGARLDAGDKDGWTALHWAAAAGNCAGIELLLRAGAGIDARANWDETALHLAAGAGATQAAMLLLDLGANAGLLDDQGRAALDNAEPLSRAELMAYVLRDTPEAKHTEAHGRL